MLNAKLLEERLTPEYIDTFINECKEYTPQPCLVVTGHGRSGKDTLADILVENYGYIYHGTSSVILCEKLYPEDPKLLYEHRHTFKEILFAFGNMIRAVDARFIPYCTLRNDGNLLVGLRGYEDIVAARSLIKAIIWMNSPVPPDTTMAYDLPDLFLLDRQVIILNNFKDERGYNYLKNQVSAMTQYLRT